MSLKIFGGADGAPQKKSTYSDDLVGRFRSGMQVDDRPVALSAWRVTTGDPEVADAIHESLGGEAPGEWDAKGEDNLEVLTDADEIEVILEGSKPLRQAMVFYGRKGVVYVSDGETIVYPDDRKGDPDPQAGQSFQERKAASQEGTGADPRVEIFFRLAEAPDLGVFKFQSGSWSLVSDLGYNDTEQEIDDLIADGSTVKATLALEEVSFVAKSGPRAGKTVSFTKPVLKGIEAA